LGHCSPQEIGQSKSADVFNKSSYNEHAGAGALLMQIKRWQSRLENFALASVRHSATAACSAGCGFHIHTGCGVAAWVRSGAIRGLWIPARGQNVSAAE